MAELIVDGEELELKLGRAEKLESMHGSLRVPISSISSVEVLDDAHKAADIIGFKVGTRIPGVVEVASVHGRDKKIFACVHRDTPRGVRVILAGTEHDEWVVGCSDPERLATLINSRLIK